MDLLSSIRKEGSRGGVDFKWSDVTTSTHRENYLGHSLMAPVGRWQKNKDLNWYAKADDAKTGPDGETAEQKRVRERKEEIRLIKEAEEDALAKALGLPVKDRTLGANGQGSGANAVDVGEMKRVIKETEEGDDEIGEVGLQKGFGNFVGKVDGEKLNGDEENNAIGGLIRKEVGKRSDHKSSRRRTDEHRSSRRHRDDDRSPRRRHDEDRSSRRHRDEDRGSRRGHGEERSSRRHRDDEGRDSQRNNSFRHDGRDEPRGGDHWRHRSHSPVRQERRYRSRTPEKRDRRKDERPDSRRGRDTIKRES